MTKRQLFLVAALGAAALVQVSLAPHFLVAGQAWMRWINFVAVTIAVIAVFEKKNNKFSWVAAFTGGVFLDLYSNPFGLWIVILVGAVAFIKLILKKYVRIVSYW